MRAYEVVAVIISLVLSDTYLDSVVTCLTCGVEEVLGKKLAGFVESVTGSLYVFRTSVSNLPMKSNYDERNR